MSYFAPYLDETGIHMPTYSDRMDALITGYRQIFGSDIYLGEDSQDYELLSLFAKAMDDCSALMLDIYNSRNPNWASGAALDTLLPLAGIRRNAATFSTVTLDLTGVPESSLAAGMLVRDAQGYSWRTTEPVTFDASGNAQAAAQCTEAGAILASTGTITIIETPTSTWYTAINNVDATPGRNTETDASVRVRRAAAVSLPGRGTVESIRAALINLNGVEHVSVLENTGSETDPNGLPPHSICALVSGGTDADIASVVFRKKSPGIATYGNASAIYQDEYGIQNTVRFSRPELVPVTVTINLRALTGWGGSYMSDAIKESIAAYVESIGIGESLIVSALWGEAFRANSGSIPAFSITGITARATSEAATSDTLEAAYDTKFVTDADHITINVTGGT